MKPIKTWRRRAFYIVQHKDENISADLAEIATQLGYFPWHTLATGVVVGLLLGVGVATLTFQDEIKTLKKELFSAQAELTLESVKCSKR